MTKPPRRIDNIEDAFEFLREIKAPARLASHATLVKEAADLLLEKLGQLGIVCDKDLVLIGVVFHDAGKSIFPEEFDVKGEKHERAGQELLLGYGVSSKIARCCVSHGQWRSMDCSFEELLVALSDTLWKGKRDDELEKRVIDEAARRLKKEVWDVYIDLDSCFENIASGGSERLKRSEEYR